MEFYTKINLTYFTSIFIVKERKYARILTVTNLYLENTPYSITIKHAINTTSV